MYSYKRQIFLRETDASRGILFSEQLNLAMEALERYYLSRGLTIQSIFNESLYHMPVVHAEASYFAPLKVGDQIAIELTLHKKGKSSFTFSATFKDSTGKLTGKAKITQVCVSCETGKPISIPDTILAHLTEL
jgi:YbgC/YbaW family acyl-CoA thioester hydrolase